MTVTIDELLKAVTDFQYRCDRAAKAKRWEEFGAARAELRAWFEEHKLPVTFPEEGK